MSSLFIPPLPQKTVYGHDSVSNQLCLNPLQSWDWRSDHKRANPFPTAPWPCSFTALIDWVSCGLVAEKNERWCLLITLKIPFSAFTFVLCGSFEQGCQQTYQQQQKKMWPLKPDSGSPCLVKKAVFCLSTCGLFVKLRHDPPALTQCANMHIK